MNKQRIEQLLKNRLQPVTCVLLGGLLVGALLAFVPAPAGPNEDPTCSIMLTLPQSALELRLDQRQIGPDLSRYQEPEGVDAVGLHQLQVMSHLAQGLMLKSGVTLRVAGHSFKPASYRMGFTVTLGGALRFFMVDGTEAVALPSTELKPGWSTERLVMHLEYVSRSDVRMIWHLGDKAGSIALGLGTSGPDPVPPTQVAPQPGDTPRTPGGDTPSAPGAPAAGQPKDGAPRGG